MARKDLYATIAGYVLKSGVIDENGLAKIMYQGIRGELKDVGNATLRILKKAVCDEIASRKLEG